MNTLKLFLVFALFLNLIVAKPRDVCILGSGASGMSASVFLKDRGYDVLVIDKLPRVGGHCDTKYFTPPSPGLQDWIELGVIIFPDTAYQNSTGAPGQWTLGSRQFAQRFLPPDSTIGFNVYVNNYGFDFIRSFPTGALPYPTPTPEYIEAFTRFYTLLATKYSWLENVHFPNPIPAELLQPFGTFIAQNNFYAIESFFFGTLYNGGMGDYHNIITLYALQNLRRGILDMYSAPGVAGFYIKEGCAAIYKGISNYIGAENILLSTNVLNVKRAGNGIVFVTYSKNEDITTVQCKNLVVAFPQLLNNLNFMDLNAEEKDIFKDVEVNFYYKMKFEVEGPIADNATFNIESIDIVNPSGIPPFPNMLVVRREISYGPASGYAYATTDMTESDMLNLVTEYTSRIPASYLTKISVDNFHRHSYQPHFNANALSQNPSPYKRLERLQGKRSTYWTGALLSFSESATIWQKTYDLINANFKKKK